MYGIVKEETYLLGEHYKAIKKLLKGSIVDVDRNDDEGYYYCKYDNFNGKISENYLDVYDGEYKYKEEENDLLRIMNFILKVQGTCESDEELEALKEVAMFVDSLIDEKSLRLMDEVFYKEAIEEEGTGMVDLFTYEELAKKTKVELINILMYGK